MGNAIKTFKKTGYTQPKNKGDEEECLFDYWDMIAFAEMHHQQQVTLGLPSVMQCPFCKSEDIKYYQKTKDCTCLDCFKDFK